MVKRKVKTLRSKLLQIIVGAMLVTGVVSLSSVAWVNFSMEGERLRDIQQHIRESISNKAATQARSHALSLRGLVSDNAFGDVRELVGSAVRNDPDVTYGVFIGPGAKPWAYATPEHSGEQLDDSTSEKVMAELGLSLALLPITRLRERTLQAFGESIHEFAAPVLGDGDEPLGTIIYGFNDRRMQHAVTLAAERSQKALKNALLLSVSVALISLALGIAWVYRSSSRITQPVAELTSLAHEIAGGKRGVRAAIASGDEVEVLAAAFNRMLQANEDAMRELEVTTQRALAADRVKSEFLANTSHEIRTPMNGVLGMIRLIQRRPLDAVLKRYVETIEVSANGLLTIINDILDFSKMEAGKYTLRGVDFELRSVIQEVAELLSGRAYDKGIELIYRISPEIPGHVHGDPDRFRQILNNLIGNAIKFTERGEVFVEALLLEKGDDGPLVSVAVHDTGVGVADADLPKLYEAFSQVDGSMVRRHGGTGLGLAISKRLVNMMGGDVQVQSRVGEGSVFSFSVRFLWATREAAEDVRVSSFGEGRRVLLFDPNARSRQALEELLRGFRLETRSADAEARCLELFDFARGLGNPFDAVVLSAGPDEHGLGALVTALRAQDPCLPVVLLTSRTGVGPLRLANSTSIELPKPPRAHELRQALLELWSLLPTADRSERPLAKLNAADPFKVLVVDDNDVNRFLAVEELTQHGCQTEEAANGEEAVAKFGLGSYSCVLMDCQMPVMDGYAATRAIRRLEQVQGRPRTPVIALTAHALEGERERVLDAGMDEFLSKPFRPSSLIALLQKYSPTEEASSKAEPEAQPAAAASEAPAPPTLLPVHRSDKLIRLFLARVPDDLKSLGQSVAANDAKAVRAAAHKLKGSSLAVGAERMNQAAEALQHQAEADAVESFAPRLAELTQQFDLVRGHLEEELAARAAAVIDVVPS